MTSRIISFPYFGKYTSVLKEVSHETGWQLMIPSPPSERTIELGVKYMNELVCFPIKTTLGSLIESAEKGATDVFTFASCGSCRQKIYWILQKQILKELGYKVNVHPISFGLHTIDNIRAIDPLLSHYEAARIFYKTITKIKKLDERIFINQMGSGVKIGILGEIYTILEPTVNMNLFLLSRHQTKKCHTKEKHT